MLRNSVGSQDAWSILLGSPWTWLILAWLGFGILWRCSGRKDVVPGITWATVVWLGLTLPYDVTVRGSLRLAGIDAMIGIACWGVLLLGARYSVVVAKRDESRPRSWAKGLVVMIPLVAFVWWYFWYLQMLRG